MSSLNWSVVNEEVTKLCGQLKSKNLDKVRDTLENLDDIFEIMPSNIDRKQLADKFAQLKFMEGAKNIFVNLEIQNQSSQELANEVVMLLIGLLISLTDHSTDASRLVVENDIHEFISRKLKDNTKASGNCLCVLMNIMRLHPDSRQQLQATGIQDVLVQLKNSDEPRKKLFAIMTLCLLHEGGGDPDSLQVESADIRRFLWGMLMKAMNETAMNSMFARFAPGIGEFMEQPISPDEIFQCLSMLAMNRDNALEMIKQGAVSQCEGYLKFVIDEPELQNSDVSPHSVNNSVKWALNLLRRLKSSVPECSVLITFQDVLTRLRDHHPNDEISQFASDLIVI